VNGGTDGRLQAPLAMTTARGEALDELGYLPHRHVAVGVRACVANARQAALPVGSEQPQRVPPFAPPGVRHLAALEHDVADRPVAKEVARGEAGVTRADDDRGDALDGLAPQCFPERERRQAAARPLKRLRR
jgi:hypothetical protein